MNQFHENLLRKIADVQMDVIKLVAERTKVQTVENEFSNDSLDTTSDETLRSHIKNVIRTAARPLSAREIRESLEVKGINTVSVDTTCSRLRQKGELVFFPDSNDSIRGKYGLPELVNLSSYRQLLIEHVIMSPETVLIQDLGDANEIERYEKYAIYRRPSPPRDARYFAPYFIRSSGRPEGISKISRVIGILHFPPSRHEEYIGEIKKFAPDAATLETWISGLRFSINPEDEEAYSHYFLRELPVIFSTPVLKDPGKVEGSGVNWITLKIPANRMVSLDTLFSKIQ